MGVNTLWPILERVQSKEEVKLADLSGKKVAVDLSGWIYESDGPAALQDKKAELRPHLRTLYARVFHLVRNNCLPVFVVEGSAPSLKQDTLKKRAEDRGTPYSVGDISSLDSCTLESGLPDTHMVRSVEQSEVEPLPSVPQSSMKPLSKFGVKVKECCELLDLLGVPWVKAAGEAEATCAWLDQNGHVDGCITDDCDAFLFGATKVYRHFTVAKNKANQMAVCTMAKIEAKLGLDRDSLIALALLVGCDYTKGVTKVGKENAMKLIKHLKGIDLLDRFQQWKSNPEFEEMDEYQHYKKPTHCTYCKHSGTKPTHTKLGCPECQSTKGCTPGLHPCPCKWHVQTRLFEEHQFELRIRKYAIRTEGFPFPEVIKEFRNPNVTTTHTQFEWHRPNCSELHKFLRERVGMKSGKIWERLLSMCTTWDMMNKGSGSVPKCITKATKSHFLPLYEVQWERVDDIAEGVVLITNEQREHIKTCFPDLVEEYEQNLIARKDAKKKRAADRKAIGGTPPKNKRIDDMFRAQRHKKRSLRFETSPPVEEEIIVRRSSTRRRNVIDSDEEDVKKGEVEFFPGKSTKSKWETTVDGAKMVVEAASDSEAEDNTGGGTDMEQDKAVETSSDAELVQHLNAAEKQCHECTANKSAEIAMEDETKKIEAGISRDGNVHEEQTEKLLASAHSSPNTEQTKDLETSSDAEFVQHLNAAEKQFQESTSTKSAEIAMEDETKKTEAGISKDDNVHGEQTEKPLASASSTPNTEQSKDVETSSDAKLMPHLNTADKQFQGSISIKSAEVDMEDVTDVSKDGHVELTEIFFAKVGSEKSPSVCDETLQTCVDQDSNKQHQDGEQTLDTEISASISRHAIPQEEVLAGTVPCQTEKNVTDSLLILPDSVAADESNAEVTVANQEILPIENPGLLQANSAILGANEMSTQLTVAHTPEEESTKLIMNADLGKKTINVPISSKLEEDVHPIGKETESIATNEIIYEVPSQVEVTSSHIVSDSTENKITDKSKAMAPKFASSGPQGQATMVDYFPVQK